MDYYKTLGVSKDASEKDLKNAYRKLAKKYHPDVNPNDKESEKKFKEINAAYDILKDDQKRAAYDRYGEAAFNGSTGGGHSAGGGFGASGFDFSSAGSSFADIFEDLFSGGGHKQQKSGGSARRANIRGSDLRYNLEITLEEAYRGEQKKVTITTHVACENCSGSGSEDKHAATECEACHGSGRLRTQQGFFTFERTCSSCQGTGTAIKNPCKKCRGQGRVKKQKTLSVSIPKGVEEGTRIRLSGEGEAGVRKGESGDLYIFISIKPHKLFVRSGNDIHCHVPVMMTTAVLGGTIEVPTLDGNRARVTIPAGTQTEHQFRLKDKGMSIMRQNNSFGDMYVHTIVETPVKLSKRQKELLKEFEEISGKESHPESEGFFKKVKEFLGH